MIRKFTTSRFSLEVIDDCYAEQVVDFYVRNKEYLTPWEPTRSSDYYKIDYQEKLLRNDYEKIQNEVLYKVWIIKDNTMIGVIALDNIVRGPFQSCHLGYKIDEKEQGQGIMTEALSVIIQYAFQELLLHRIEANIMPKNKASLRVVEKLGYYNEGLARKYLRINGIWEDHIHMVLINDEMK